MYDGSIKILTKLSTEGFDKGKQHLERGLSKLSGSMQRAFKGAFATQPMSKEFERARLKVQDTEIAIAALTEKMEGLRAEMALSGVEGSDQYRKLENEAKKYIEDLKQIDEQYARMAGKKIDEMGIKGMPESVTESLLRGDKELEKLAQSGDKAEKKLADVRRRMEELKVSGKGLTSPQQAELKKLERQYDNQILKLKQYENRMEEASNVVVESSKKTSKQVSATARMINRMLLRMIIFGSIALILRSLTQGMKNLAQVSDGANKTISELSASFTKLKNALATAVLPALQAIAPVLIFITNAFANLFTLIGMFTARITGNATSIIKAKKAQVDYAKSLDGTAKSAKKAVGALAGFDELDVLSKQDEMGGAGASGVGDMFEEVQIPADVLSVADKIKKVMTDIVDLFKPFAEPIGVGLRWFFDNVLKPIGEWTISELIPRFFGLLASVLGVLLAVLVALKPLAAWLWEKFLKPLGQWTGRKIIEGLEWLTEKLDSLAEWIGNNKGKVRAFAVVVGVFAAAWGLVNLAIGLWNVIGAVAVAVTTAFGVAVGILTSPITLVILAVAALIAIVILLIKNWDIVKKTAIRVWDKIKEVWGKAANWFDTKVLTPIQNRFKAVINGILGFAEKLANGFINAINAIIRAFNRISFSIPDWVPVIGGNSWGFNLREVAPVTIPRLATGAVIPPNAEFLAVLGDQKHGRNIEAPESLLRQIVAEESGETVIRFEGNLGQLMRVLKPYIDKENKRVGVSLVEGTI